MNPPKFNLKMEGRSF